MAATYDIAAHGEHCEADLLGMTRNSDIDLPGMTLHIVYTDWLLREEREHHAIRRNLGH